MALNYRSSKPIDPAWASASGCAAAVLNSTWLNLRIDREQGGEEDGGAVDHPGIAGFKLEDGIYQVAPLPGWLSCSFSLCGLGQMRPSIACGPC